MRIIVGMSGGVDSSLTAALLKQQGHDVIGVTLQLYDYEQSWEDTDPSKRHCHPLAFIQDARQVADHLGIEHHVLHHQHHFQSTIIDPFMKAYEKGHTPLPCATCNRDVKTSALYEIMQSMGADAMATGHYVRRVDMGSYVQIHQGHDEMRDQSFFLFALGMHFFDKLYFPLGAYSKQDTRQQAMQFRLNVATTPASQDLCFIAKKSYKTMFEPIPGDIVHIDTHQIVGQHQGITNFTIGQRQGLGIGGQQVPLHVIDIDRATNRVWVGPRERLARKAFALEDVNWIAPDLQGDEHALHVKIRSSGKAVPAKVILDRHKRHAHVHLENPDYAIAPGQACVFYSATRLLGGGWIRESKENVHADHHTTS